MPALWISDCTTTESRDGLLLAKHRYYTHNPYAHSLGRGDRPDLAPSIGRRHPPREFSEVYSKLHPAACSMSGSKCAQSAKLNWP